MRSHSLVVSETDSGRPSTARMLSPRMERVRSVSFLMPYSRATRPDLGRGGRWRNMSQPPSLCKTLVVRFDALQRQPPLHILNARDCVAAEFPKFEHLPRPITGPAARAS